MITIGTHSLRAEECIQTVKLALDLNYTRIDTASAYKNEHLVSEGIHQHFLSHPQNESTNNNRSNKNIHITTKVGPKDISKGYEGVKKCVQQSLEKLHSCRKKNLKDDDNENGTSNNDYYIDCVLLHWPGASGLRPDSEKHKDLRREAWRALCDLRKAGLVKEIGVSNFLVRHLDSLLSPVAVSEQNVESSPVKENDDNEEVSSILSPSTSSSEIDVVQMELHPWCRQQDVVDWCVKHKVKRIESYGIFGGGKCLERTAEMLKKEQQESGENNSEENASRMLMKEAAHLLLQWCIKQGFVPVVRASKKEHLEQNLIFLQERPVRDRRDLFDSDCGDDDKSSKKEDEHFYWHSNLIA